MPSRAKADALVLADVTRAAVARRFGSAPVAHPAFVNSLPKAGTNLLLKLVGRLPGLREVRLPLNSDYAQMYPPGPGEASVPAGVASPSRMSLPWLERTVGRLPAGTWFRGHMPFSPEFRDLLAAHDVRMVLMLRDPRDVVVSSADYLASRPDHALSARFSELSAHDRILASITGFADADGRALCDIRERVLAVAPWMSEPFVYVTRFERLVGAAGGGSTETQLAEITAIAEHVGAPLTAGQAAELADGLFGGTHTFRKGRIGGWRETFSDAHLEAAKPLLDDLLVEMGYETSTDWVPAR